MPKPGAEFVTRMEDVLDVYQRHYDPLCPVVCLAETNRQLIEKRRIPANPGSVKREDYEYRRCGVVELFVAFEPLACKRIVKLTTARTAVDFAHFLRELVDIHYSHCEKIVLIMDNLNIHSIASFYKAFEPTQARRIIQRLEIHYTPIHASWLNMAEIEIGILSRQCLSQSLTSFDEMHRQVNAWMLNRNSVCSTVHWRFASDDAKGKFRKLYPVFF
ncbi:IS630 family transposase [Butyricicoccus sp. 1XD8-22]|nr:IS630 family transposase [Butyricicoccus sp. 1XD8-22]